MRFKEKNFFRKRRKNFFFGEDIYNSAIRCSEGKEVKRRAPNDSQIKGGKKMRKICKECLKEQHPAVKGMCPVELIPADEVKICPIWTIKNRREFNNERKTVQ